MDGGLFIVRCVFGALMAVHGSQKLFGWFGGYGLAGPAASLRGSDFDQAHSLRRSEAGRNARGTPARGRSL